MLGALPEDERATVAANITEYPELAAEVAAIEAAMYRFAEANADTPPAHLQDDIWAAIKKSGNAASGHASPPTTKTMPFAGTHTAPGWQRAAIWIALAGSLLANIWLWNERNRSKEDQLALQRQMDGTRAEQQKLAAKLEAYSTERAMLTDASMQPVIMRSVQQEKPMAGMVMYNKVKEEAYVSVMNMPMPPAGKQYQFWVIQDGKPVDMGVLPNEMITNGGLQKVPMHIRNGQAFAISLEKEGGNPTPTEVMVVGAISS